MFSTCPIVRQSVQSETTLYSIIRQSEKLTWAPGLQNTSLAQQSTAPRGQAKYSAVYGELAQLSAVPGVVAQLSAVPRVVAQLSAVPGVVAQLPAVPGELAPQSAVP